jgi:hypothetical protein
MQAAIGKEQGVRTVLETDFILSWRRNVCMLLWSGNKKATW